MVVEGREHKALWVALIADTMDQYLGLVPMENLPVVLPVSSGDAFKLDIPFSREASNNLSDFCEAKRKVNLKDLTPPPHSANQAAPDLPAPTSTFPYFEGMLKDLLATAQGGQVSANGVQFLFRVMSKRIGTLERNIATAITAADTLRIERGDTSKVIGGLADVRSFVLHSPDPLRLALGPTQRGHPSPVSTHCPPSFFLILLRCLSSALVVFYLRSNFLRKE